MGTASKPAVLFVYYSYTKQTLKVVETMAGVLRDRGCDVVLAGIEFIDPRYADRFKTFPMPHPYLEVFGMIPPELLRSTADIRIPSVVTEREYDFVCIASPMALTRKLRSRLASEERDDILSADAKQLLASFVSFRLRSHVNATLHLLHTPNGGVVGYIQQRCNLTRGVHFFRLQFRGLFTGTLLEAAATGICEQFIDVLADLVKIRLAPRMRGGGGHRPQTANTVWLQNAHIRWYCFVLLFVLAFCEEGESCEI